MFKLILRDASVAVKMTAAIVAFIITTGVPGLFYFYKVNAWAEDVKASEQQLARAADREILEGKLAIAKTQVILYLSIKEQRELTPVEELELDIALDNRKTAAAALAATTAAAAREVTARAGR